MLSCFKYYSLLVDGDFSVLHSLGKHERRKVLAGLSNLSKFLGCYGRFKMLKELSGVSWGRVESFEVFNRIYNNNSGDVVNWVLKMKEKLPFKFYFPIVFQALTGVRPQEAVISLNLIVEKGLDGYFNLELSTLEHFRFPELFLRKTKNLFISFITPKLLDYLKNWNKQVSWDAFRCKLKRRGLGVKLQELRSYYATLLREHGIPKESVDLIQGRISKDVFTRFYYKPYLHQLKEKVLETIKPLEQKFLN